MTLPSPNQINEGLKGRKVHLIGHSLGGLDCRYLVTHLMEGAEFEVLSITTICTPHRGTPFADFMMDLEISEQPIVSLVLECLPFGQGDGGGFASITTNSTQDFNATTLDVAGVRYLSYGCSFEPHPLELLCWGYSFSLVKDEEGPNDGFIPIESAKCKGHLTLSHCLDLTCITRGRVPWHT
ncbi:unnamed protein product [Rhizoctonia solani]|uniref:GPI inositol-deacylase n=1 Tax=Rhizoctonia solani TaxID=456999 RepID=A0A8H3H213_9AGAM|nr:unnamed protein product [Rhizoctonia solani]